MLPGRWLILFSDLIEIKKILQLDPNDPSEDFLLGLYNEWATGILEELLNRSFTYKVRTVVYPGSGTQKLVLKHRPVYPTTAPAKASTLPFTALSVVEDQNANWGASAGAFTGTPLVYGTDFAVRVDQDDGGSREAVLYRIGNYWTKPIVREQGTLSPFVGPDMGSVQVTSTAGYTIDMLPSSMRAAATLLITKLAYIFPLGLAVTSESYIDRNISLSEENKNYLMALVKPLCLAWHRNWKF